MRPLPNEWNEPPWDEPLDPHAFLAAMPEGATMKGSFLAAVAGFAADRGFPLPLARDRYVPFASYPLREHGELMVQAARMVYPDRPLREGLRRIGRGAPGTLVRSLLGRVVLGSAEGALEVLRAMVRSYELHTPPVRAELVEVGPSEAIVRMEEVYHFLDSHHVGVFEGVFRYVGVEGHIRIHAYSRVTADLLCRWSPRPTR